MSDSNASPVFMFNNEDPAMQRAYEQARATFRYFWREMAWERRRIVPGLDMSCVKAPFSDGPDAPASNEHPSVEQMWMSDVDFDGKVITGNLLNSPNWLTTVKEGDAASFTLGEITDWMYVIAGEVYGAYTVNLLRSRMSPAERREHDDAWGLNFGDPAKIRVVPAAAAEEKKPGFFAKLFGKTSAPAAAPGGSPSEEHPMSLNMAASLKEEIAKNPAMLKLKDDRGWTFLHQEALAGSAPTVKLLLDAGADRNARTNDGRTALDLAKSLEWNAVVALLSR